MPAGSDVVRDLGTAIAEGLVNSGAAKLSAPESTSEQHGVALIVPRDFERDVERGEPTQVQAIVDGTNPERE